MSAGPSPGGAETADPETADPAGLPQPLPVVLEQAGAIVAGRPGAAPEHRRLTATTGGLRLLLELLERSAGLRRATSLRAAVAELSLPDPAAGTSGADPRQVAANLIDPAGTYAAAAAAEVSRWLDPPKPAGKRARRRDRRARRPPPPERAEKWSQAKIKALRAARDRARRQADSYRDEAAALREQVSAQSEENAALNARVAELTTRLGEARRAATDPRRGTDRLAPCRGRPGADGRARAADR